MPEVPLQAGCQRGDAGLSKTEKHIPYAQLPKPLINLPISVGAKLLYALLNDRFQLSLKNDFKDEDGFVFCYFSNREICEKLRCAHCKATKLLRELENTGLIYRVKIKGKADRIYVGGIQDDEDEVCRFSAENRANHGCAGMPKSGTEACRFSATSNTDYSKQEFYPIYTEENKARLASLLERLDMNSFFSAEAESELRQLVEHIRIVLETEFPVLRVGGTDHPTEIVRDAYDRLTREDVKEILDDFRADPLSFGSMRIRLFEAGRRHGIEHGTVSASNDSWAHEAACQGAEPLKPHETEEAS